MTQDPRSGPRWRFLLRWLGFAGLCFGWIFFALQLRSPYLLAFRQPALCLCLGLGACAALAWIQRARAARGLGPAQTLLACTLILGSLLAGVRQARHVENRCWVLAAPAEQLPAVRNTLVIGWLGLERTRALAAKGAIAGVFLTRRDFPPGATIEVIRATVDLLQDARRTAGLPALWIATDQEGGPVSKLSPAVARQPGLGSLLADLDGPGLSADGQRQGEIVRRTRQYAEIQGQALAAAGINLNFAPVLDLRPDVPTGFLDRHTRIASRALGRDPAVVALAGETYVRVLASHGVTAVLKHFPGLRRVPADTHHFSATLHAAAAELEGSDWLPFREVAQRTQAGVMLGHVRLPALDPAHPASCSGPIARGLLRQKWRMTGLLVTDDFSMAPIFYGPGGIVGAAERSRSAGVDLILLSYDAEAVFDLLAGSR